MNQKDRIENLENRVLELETMVKNIIWVLDYKQVIALKEEVKRK